MRKALKRLWNDESGQGATEYILILVAVVAVAIIFRGQLLGFVNTKLGEISSGIGSITTTP